MAKGIGLIGNFRGKVGNMVGYNLKDSNNKQTQGVRVYQPVVKNPKTYGQAEQRAKLAPINATYRALKAIIDRGQEGKAYGNKSRLAWLSEAMKAFNGGWFEKGAAITAPALVPLTKGSLAALSESLISENTVMIDFNAAPAGGAATVGALTPLILGKYQNLKSGDQITAVGVYQTTTGIEAIITSIVLDVNSTEPLPANVNEGETDMALIAAPAMDVPLIAGAIIVSREGDNGAHLRSTTSLVATDAYPATTQGDDAKQAAIKSYMSASANTDWAEESIQ